MAIQSLGYAKIGQSTKLYPGEMLAYQATLYSNIPGADVKDYGIAQGYEMPPTAPAVTGGSVVPMLPPGWSVPHAAE
jgi:hypothetical protein